MADYALESVRRIVNGPIVIGANETLSPGLLTTPWGGTPTFVSATAQLIDPSLAFTFVFSLTVSVTGDYIRVGKPGFLAGTRFIVKIAFSTPDLTTWQAFMFVHFD